MHFRKDSVLNRPRDSFKIWKCSFPLWFLLFALFRLALLSFRLVCGLKGDIWSMWKQVSVVGLNITYMCLLSSPVLVINRSGCCLAILLPTALNQGLVSSWGPNVTLMISFKHNTLAFNQAGISSKTPIAAQRTKPLTFYIHWMFWGNQGAVACWVTRVGAVCKSVCWSSLSYLHTYNIHFNSNILINTLNGKS